LEPAAAAEVVTIRGRTCRRDKGRQRARLNQFAATHMALTFLLEPSPIWNLRLGNIFQIDKHGKARQWLNL
jgi:hypothetical protein